MLLKDRKRRVKELEKEIEKLKILRTYLSERLREVVDDIGFNLEELQQFQIEIEES